MSQKNLYFNFSNIKNVLLTFKLKVERILIMKVVLPKVIELKDVKGSNVSVDLAQVEMSDEQREALTSVYSKAMMDDAAHSITEDEFSKIANLKSVVNFGPDISAIVRFDWKWVKISEPLRTLEDLVGEL